MKKRLILLFGLLMILSLVGCSRAKETKKNLDPETIYEDAAKKTAELKDMDGRKCGDNN